MTAERNDRAEHDSLGEVDVPADVLWGAQTQRAVENFAVSGIRVPVAVVRALALIKVEAAVVNAEVDPVVFPTVISDAIVAAGLEVASGVHDAQFPIDAFQTGSGTSTNMNVNEVIAHLATDRLGIGVHPNDHVNASQSSNDVVPSAVRIAALRAIHDGVLPSLDHLVTALRSVASEHRHTVKPGRTHLMDAVPVTVGQEFDAFAAQLVGVRRALVFAGDAVAVLPLGGTAVGNGLNAPGDFGPRTVRRLAQRTGLPLHASPTPLALQAGHDDLVGLSAALRTYAVVLTKIANDLRWMASGPQTGLAEISLPSLQPGSSIMPGKVNPVIPEVVVQVAAQVHGNDATIALCGAQGSFELNATIPIVALNLLQSTELLANVARVFADRCVQGIVVDVDRARALAGASPAIATALNRALGYDTVATIVQEAVRSRRTIAEVVLAGGYLDREALDGLLDLDGMAEPHRDTYTD